MSTAVIDDPATGAAAPPEGLAAAVTHVRAVMADVAQRVEAAGRDPGSVRIVAVTKGQPVLACRAALAAGLADLGENYAQELVAKAADPSTAGARWHAIGPLQRNKLPALVGAVALWQSVDRPALVAALAARAPGASVLVQVNLAGDPDRPGTSFSDLPALVAEAVAAGLEVRGLMGVAPLGGPEAARPGFRRLAAAAADLGLAEVSMGMSGDLDVALAEGATMVRLGRALFGARPAPGGAAGARRTARFAAMRRTTNDTRPQWEALCDG